MTMAQQGPGGFYANAGLQRLSAGLSAGVLWPIGALANTLRWGRSVLPRHGAHQDPADAPGHRGRLRAVPAGARLGVAWSTGRGARAGCGRAVRVQPRDHVRLRAVGPDGCGRGPGHPAGCRGPRPGQQRGRRVPGHPRGAHQAPVRAGAHPARRGAAAAPAPLPPRIGPSSGALGAGTGCVAGSPGSRAGPADHVRGRSRWSRSTSWPAVRHGHPGIPAADVRHGRGLRVPVGQRLQPLGAHRFRRCAVTGSYRHDRR